MRDLKFPSKEEFNKLDPDSKKEYIKLARELDIEREDLYNEIREALISEMNSKFHNLLDEHGVPACFGNMSRRYPYPDPKEIYADENLFKTSNILEEGYYMSPDFADDKMDRVLDNIRDIVNDTVKNIKVILRCSSCPRDIFDRCAIISDIF